MSDDTDNQPAADQNPASLLEEGAKSYLEALTAIAVFRREILSRSQQVLRQRLSAYGQALGLDLSAYPMTPWLTPEDQLDGTFVVLGWQQGGFQLPSLLSRWCGSYLGLCWDSSDLSLWFGACAAMYLNRAKECEDLFNEFKTRGVSDPFTLWKDRNMIWLGMKLCPTEMPLLEQKLEELLSKWIQLWSGQFSPLTKSPEEKGTEPTP